MKKQRAILIKDPRLRKVRNELRALLNLWLADTRRALRDKFWNSPRKEGSLEAQRELSKLRLLQIRSICYCLLCGKSDKDMIYIPDLSQWICIDCNTERIYFSSLRCELNISTDKINEFLERLGRDININRFGSKCNGYKNSKRILNQMGVPKETQKKLYELFYYYDGHCDCEILLNASLRLID